MTKIRLTPRMTRRDARDAKRTRQRFVRRQLKLELFAYVEYCKAMRADNKTPGPWPTQLTVWLAKRERTRR